MDLDKLTIDRGPGPRRAHRGKSPWLRWAMLALGLAGVFLVVRPMLIERLGSDSDLGPRDSEVAEAESSSSGRSRASSAAAGTTATGQAGSKRSGAAANGYLVARRRAALSADTPGRIVELNVEEGTVVAKGDVVARLFADEVEASLRRAEADLASGKVAVAVAEASVTSAQRRLVEAAAFVQNVASQRDEVKAGLDLAIAEFDRTSKLVERGAVPREQFDRVQSAQIQARARLAGADAASTRAEAAVGSAESDVTLAELRLAQAQANIASLEATRDLARATLDKTIVRAPFDGVVVLKDAEVGEVVSPNALGGQSRGSVATMVDFSTLEVQVELPETSLDSVEVGARAEVYVDAFASERFEGTVARIWPTANRQKATIEVRVALEAIDPRMRPEMGARVVFPRRDEASLGASQQDDAEALDVEETSSGTR